MAKKKNLFDQLPDRLFAPLSSRNNRLYSDLILALYHAFFDEAGDSLDDSYEEPAVRSFIEQYLIDNGEDIWVIDELTATLASTELTTVKQKANAIYNRLVDCGWLSREKLGFRVTVFMPPRVVETVEFMDGLTNNLGGEIGGSLFMIYSTMRSMIDNANELERVHGLRQVLEESKRVARKMNRLASHLRTMAERIERMTDLAEKTNVFFEDFLAGTSFTDYKDIKERNHPYRYKDQIIEMIDQIGARPATRMEFLMAIDKSGAALEVKTDPETHLDDILRKIRNLFLGSDAKLDRIERNHARLVRRVTESLKYQQRSPAGFQNKLAAAIGALFQQGVDNESLAGILNPLTAIDLVSPEGFSQIRAPRKPINSDAATKIKALSEEAKIATGMRREYAEFVKMNDEKLEEWLSRQIAYHGDHVNSHHIVINNSQELSAFSTARRLAFPNEKLRALYPNVLSRFKFEINERAVTEHDAVYCFKFTVLHCEGEE